MPCRGSKKHDGRRAGLGCPSARARALARWYWPSAMDRLTAPMSFTVRAASSAAVPRSYAFSAAACSAAASGLLRTEMSESWLVRPALSAIRSSCAADLASLSSCRRRRRMGRMIRKPPRTASRTMIPATIRTVLSPREDPLDVLPVPVPVPGPGRPAAARLSRIPSGPRRCCRPPGAAGPQCASVPALAWAGSSPSPVTASAAAISSLFIPATSCRIRNLGKH